MTEKKDLGGGLRGCSVSWRSRFTSHMKDLKNSSTFLLYKFIIKFSLKFIILSYPGCKLMCKWEFSPKYIELPRLGWMNNHNDYADWIQYHLVTKLPILKNDNTCFVFRTVKQIGASHPGTGKYLKILKYQLFPKF